MCPLEAHSRQYKNDGILTITIHALTGIIMERMHMEKAMFEIAIA